MLKRFFASSDTQAELVRLAHLSEESTSDIEDRAVDAAIESICRKALDQFDESDIEAALAQLKDEDGPAYDDLLAHAEDCAQSIIGQDKLHLLVLIPVFAWSRFKLPFGKLPKETLVKIAELYKSLYMEDDASIVIGDSLICAEHIPERLKSVRELLNAMTTRQKSPVSVFSIAKLLNHDPAPDFADTRYLVVALTAAKADAMFKQLSRGDIERARTHMDFSLRCHDILETDMRGCVFAVQPPSGFFSAWRQAENAMRVYALKALVGFVGCMGFGPSELIATTAVFTRPTPSANEPNAEIRIGISTRISPDQVVAGITWPCNPEEADPNQNFAGEVLASLQVSRIAALDQVFTMEWCEDCGAPLYANPEGYVTHIEVPESMQQSATPTLN